MAVDEPEVPDLAGEGVSTLAAQFTRQAVDRIVGIIRRERARGVSEATLARAMEKNMRDYDEHTRGLLLRLGSGGALPDDFPTAIVTASQQSKPNTLELTLVSIPKDIALYSLVHHGGREWLVVDCKGNQCTLKLLQ